MSEKAVNTGNLGAYLKSQRSRMELSLRQVEELTDKEISNAYLSQLENGGIKNPSPNILYTLASVYDVEYEGLMRRAGYIVNSGQHNDEQKHGKAATNAIENLSSEEEAALLEYLEFIRRKKK
jgi:transcriptional regulator with XRE-family HTH domain